MKIFTNKRLFKKILIVLVAIILFSAVVPPKVAYASEAASTVGGSLLSPVASLLIGLGDVVMNIIHKAVYDLDSSYILITRKSDAWGIFWTIVAAVVAIVVVAVVAYFTAGAGVAILAKLGVSATIGASTIGTIVTVSLGAGVLAGSLTALDWFGDNVVFPTYQISPEEIFKGEVDLLDINFFDPKTKVEKNITVERSGEKVGGSGIFPFNDLKKAEKECEVKPGLIDYIDVSDVNIPNNLWQNASEGIQAGDPADYFYNYATPFEKLSSIGAAQYELSYYQQKAQNDKDLKEELDSLLAKMNIDPNKLENFKVTLEIGVNGMNTLNNDKRITILAGKDINNDGYFDIKWGYYGYDQFIATLRIDGQIVASVEQTFLYRQVQSLDMVIDGEYEGKVTYVIYEKATKAITTETENIELVSLGAQLKETVTKWYYTIRNFVLVVMMLILIYIGIRIMLSGISSEKAKYKNMLMDWLVAICLVFIMHYIMVFAMNLVDGITDIFATVGNGEDPYANIYEIDTDMYNKLKDEISQEELDKLIVKENGTEVKNGDGNKYIMWDAKNLLGMARIQAALTESGTITYIGYGIIFLALVFYTLFFLFTYIKRALYLTFFTIIAPLVAMTYPIDKLHDGKAQAFDMWFKEYIFNLMIQPVHLLLYTVLISSAFDLASSNMLYALVAIGFMMPAEKFIRKMFGFNKAETPGFLGGAVGAGVMMGLANRVFHKRPSKGGKFIEDKEKTGKEDKINMKDDSAVDPFLLAEAPNVREDNNILSSQEQARQQQKAQQEMEKARIAAQTANTSAKSYINKDGNVGFNRAGNLKKQYDDTQLKRSIGQLKKSREEQEQKQKKNGFWRRQGRGIKAATKAYAKQKFIRFGNNLATGKPIRDIAKIGGGLYLGATGAILGGTIGLTSGELKNITGYGATLGVGGYALGARDLKSHPDGEKAIEEYRRAQYASEEEYRKHLLEQQREEVARNEKKLEELRTYLKLDDQKQARNYMEEYGECIDAGITDMEDFATIIKAVEEEQWSKEMAITAAKYYKKAGGKPKNMGKKDRENIEFQYKNIVKANGVTDEEEADRAVKTMLSNLDRYGKIKDDLTQV